MGQLKLLRGNLANLGNVAVVDGQLLFVKDDKSIYADIGSNRIRFSDIITISTKTALPATGEANKLYLIQDTSNIAIWNGSDYNTIGDITVETTGDGNALTAIAYDVETGKLVATKGAAFADAGAFNELSSLVGPKQLLPTHEGIENVIGFVQYAINKCDQNEVETHSYIDGKVADLNKTISAHEEAATAEFAAVREEMETESQAREAAEKAIQDQVNAINNGTDGILAQAKAYADQSEADAVATAKAYTDEVKAGILGEGLTETFDTLKEIEDWINGAGVNATELTQAIAEEAQLRVDGDKAVQDQIDAMNNETTGILAEAKSYADQSEADAIATAAADATSKANAALANAQTYADQAEADAIATAADDATTKADAALANANLYTNEKVSESLTASLTWGEFPEA